MSFFTPSPAFFVLLSLSTIACSGEKEDGSSSASEGEGEGEGWAGVTRGGQGTVYDAEL